MSRILIIEDESSIRRVLVKILEDEKKGYQIFEAENGLEGVNFLDKQSVDLIMCDIKMPKMDGIEVLKNVRNTHPELPVIMISGHGDLETAVEAMRIGAFDYISKPPDLNRLLNCVRNALDSKKQIQKTPTQNKKVSPTFQMIGESEAITKIKSMIEKVAPSNARVLITGPNGTGKELVAHWIHQKSVRSRGPMIEINCAAIPSELIESELFGHVKGSFTSANKDRAGKFEAANGGTLFLDEIGDMSLSAQAKVLRALQEHKVQRVGSDKDIVVDVRVIAATNKNLSEEINHNRFREDLYHRLAVIEIPVPPLNDRKDDIPLLVNYFLEQIASEQGTSVKRFQSAALKKLQEFDWSGNVRELRNVIERLTILSGDEISTQDVVTFANKL
jgi:DNA-binding NtrC family response regulator